MFIYFIQKKGFLDKDENYLEQQTAPEQRIRARIASIRDFLCPLFFEGLQERKRIVQQRSTNFLVKIPYLNGGLFLKHQIEELHGKHIQIPDKAFEKLFDFFDQYQWHLDERPLNETTRSIRMSSVTSSRSTSTRSRWALTTPRRTSLNISARTRLFPSSSTQHARSARLPLKASSQSGDCSRLTRTAIFIMPLRKELWQI